MQVGLPGEPCPPGVNRRPQPGEAGGVPFGGQGGVSDRPRTRCGGQAGHVDQVLDRHPRASAGGGVGNDPGSHG
jgi:hypothetical protein